MVNKKRLLQIFLIGIFMIFVTTTIFLKYNKEDNAVKIPKNKSKTVLAFTTYYYPDDKASYNKMIQNAGSISSIATNTYTVDSKGNLSGTVPTQQIEYANSNKIETLAMITNNFNGNTVKLLLESSTNRSLLINNILNTLKANNYKGVNIDFENVYYYDRNYYTSFLKELYTQLNSKGFIVTASVPAKTNDNVKAAWSGAYDYKEIAKYTDQVIIMAYDEHSPDGASGPVASIDWVKNTIKYATTKMPASRIVLGVASYGYDWSKNGVKAYGIDSIFKLAENYNSNIQWSDVYKSPFFKYKDKLGVNHTVWFENSTSLSYKLDVVNDNNLSGIAIWRLGLENEAYWSTIKAKL